MGTSKFRRMPYQYPVILVGSRRLKQSHLSFANPKAKTFLTNVTSSIRNDTSSNVNSERNILLRSERQADLDVAASGYGSYCPEGIPVETALFAVMGAAALAFGILFMAITMITMGGRRKRRDASLYSNNQHEASLGILSDLIWQGRILSQTS